MVTLHDGDLKALNDLYNKCSKSSSKTEYMGQGSGYLLYEIIAACYEYCFPLVDKTSRNIRLVEKDLFISEDDQKEILEKILIIKRNIINISRILMPQSNILTKLEAKNKKFLPENLEVYFDDIKDTSDKIKDILILNREVINVLHGIHESLISERTNRVMKLLTVFSVIMLPLTFLTGLWGMNVELPFAANPLAFWAIGIIMSGIMFFMIIVFKIKKWI
jgi:magnesium transporter